MNNVLKNIKDAIQGKAKLGTRRSSKWSGVRKEFLKGSPRCAICGGTEKVEVHHVVPFHEDPTKELEPTNLITLCESKRGGLTCHLAIGHGGNYRKANPRVREDSTYLGERLSEIDRQYEEKKAAAKTEGEEK